MPIDIIVPRLGWSMEEGAFVAWLKEDGAWVQAGEPLFSIEGDKAIQEIESIDSGILRILPGGPKPGDSIRVGDVLGQLVPKGESPQEYRPSHRDPETRLPAAATAVPSGSSSPEAMKPAPQPVSEPAAPWRPSPQPSTEKNSTSPRRTISPRALRVASELGVDWTKIIGTGRTGRIRERDIRDAAARSREPQGSVASGSEDSLPTVLVTGGCGFIGTWVIRTLLSRRCRVVVLDAGPRPPRWERLLGIEARRIPLIQGSLLDRGRLAQVFAEYPITHVIHLAALLTPDCQSDPWLGCQVNVLGTVAIFEQIHAMAGRVRGLSYASSVAVFGDEPDTRSSTEEDGQHPMTFYGAFKKAVEGIAQQYWRHFGIRSLGIRPQVAYGPERETGLTAGPTLAARAVARGEPYCIRYTGRVGYDYVEDVAEAFVRGALDTPEGAPVVDLPGEAADVDQVVAAIAKTDPQGAALITVEGPAIPATTPPRPRSIATLYPNWTTTSLVEGLRKTVEHYRISERG